MAIPLPSRIQLWDNTTQNDLFIMEHTPSSINLGVTPIKAIIFNAPVGLPDYGISNLGQKIDDLNNTVNNLATIVNNLADVISKCNRNSEDGLCVTNFIEVS